MGDEVDRPLADLCQFDVFGGEGRDVAFGEIFQEGAQGDQVIILGPFLHGAAVGFVVFARLSIEPQAEATHGIGGDCRRVVAFQVFEETGQIMIVIFDSA